MDSTMIIILNLDRAEKRKQELINQFNKRGIIDYMFFPSFDAKYMTNMTIGANIGMGYGIGRRFQKAELAIIMTHLAALNYASMMNYENVIILEDDVVLCEDWFDRLADLKTQLPENWEYTYLSGHSDYVQFTKYKKSTLLKAPKMVGAFSYMVNKTAYKKIIKYCMSFMTTFDDMIMHMIDSNKLNGYVYFPFMTFHNADDSFVWDKTPNHLVHTNNMHSSYTFFKFNL